VKAVVLIALLILGGCSKKEEVEEAPQQVRKVPVEVVKTANRTIRDTLVSTSTVDARTAVDVVAEVPGVVIALDVEQGDEVKKGQRIAQVQREELNFGLDSARSVVGRLEGEVERLKPLYEKGVISRQVFEEANWRLQEARSEQKRAGMAASDLRSTAPMSGVVALRYVNLGQQVATGSPLFRIVDPSNLIVAVNLPENALGRIFEGQAAYLESDALPGKRFDGAVERISPVVDPRTGTLRIQISLSDEAAKALRPGMFVKTHIVTSERSDVLAIPRRAVIFVDDQATVFTVAQDIATRKSVELGITEGSWVEITSGLSAEDRVVVLGQEGLKSGTPVDPVQRDGG
jgi:membrane fusion protein (multidrug efflux system)